MPTALHAVRAQHSTRQSIRLGPFGHLQPHRDTTRVAGESILRVHVLPAFGQRPISSIETSEVQSWVTRLGQATYDANGAVVRAGLSPSTIEVVYGKVAAVFNAAIEDRLISRTLCGSRRVKMPRKDGGDILPMSPEQVAAMAAALPAHYRALVVLIAGTGLRPGEAVGLTNDRVKWLHRRIQIDRQLVMASGEAPRFGPVKTEGSNRTAAVPDAVLEVLAAHVEQFGLGPHDLLFTHDKGDPIRRSAMGHAWRRAAPAAGVVGYSWHDLRHYAASVMIAEGASVKAVQKQLGHENASTTLDTYAHLFPDAEESTRNALAAGIAQIVSPLCHEVSPKAAT